MQDLCKPSADGNEVVFCDPELCTFKEVTYTDNIVVRFRMGSVHLDPLRGTVDRRNENGRLWKRERFTPCAELR